MCLLWPNEDRVHMLSCSRITSTACTWRLLAGSRTLWRSSLGMAGKMSWTSKTPRFAHYFDVPWRGYRLFVCIKAAVAAHACVMKCFRLLCDHPFIFFITAQHDWHAWNNHVLSCLCICSCSCFTRLLYRDGANKLNWTQRGNTCLHAAAINGRVDVAEYLLSKAGKPLMMEREKEVWLPVPTHMLSSSVHAKCVR